MRGAAFLFAAAGLALSACDAATTSAAASGEVSRADADFPERTGRVVDSAALLSSAQEAKLSQQIERLEARTSDQLVIVTVPSLENRSIEDYSLALANDWGVGQAGKDNGVLILVAPNDRRIRIEVGSGLESVLSNARAKQIIDSDLMPFFREARWFEGLEAGTGAIATTLADRAAVRRGKS